MASGSSPDLGLPQGTLTAGCLFQTVWNLKSGNEPGNQARVHLWYQQKFGSLCPPLTRVEDGIDRYLIACTQCGIGIRSGEVYAPDGLGDMRNGILRINPNNPQTDLFLRKCQDYKT
ncbi:nucleotidyltransferase family protein [Rhizobium mongolense]|uniref:Uncharacterized protein n=1 Tax=Rhizobium mongolense TaxID=57676 RepID=A0ABR6IKK0_9HYPH|nr:nucleotidyltransferase family protein [Rhizobium mongolense]MBB4228399.1 hypothetical protein [Rhizobium mongolense]